MIGKGLPGVAYQYATLPSFNDYRTLNSSIKSTTNGVRLLGYINTHHVINNKTVRFSLATSNICESGLFLPEIATAHTITGNNSCENAYDQVVSVLNIVNLLIGI